MIARGTGVAVFRNFGIPHLNIFGSRLNTDFWNLEVILWCIMTCGSKDLNKVLPISSQYSIPTVYSV